MNDRALRAVELRRNGHTLRQIAELYGCSRERARQLCAKGGQLQSPDIWFELHAYIRNALKRDGCAPTVEAVMERYQSLDELKRVPGLGVTRIAELQAWLRRHGTPIA